MDKCIYIPQDNIFNFCSEDSVQNYSPGTKHSDSMDSENIPLNFVKNIT